MATVRDFYNAIDKVAPFESQWSSDNCGLLIGSMDNEVTGVVLSLDVTNEAIALAEKIGANLILTHHPVIFYPIKNVNSNTVVYKAIEKNINVISAHTNLDIAKNIGVNATLSKLLELKGVKPFKNHDNIGEIGDLPYEMTVKEFASYAKSKLNSISVRYCLGENKVKRIALISGSCGDYLEESKEVADLLLSGEAKISHFVDAHNMGLPLVAAGHYDTEAVVLKPLMEYLQPKFKTLNFELLDFNVTSCL